MYEMQKERDVLSSKYITYSLLVLYLLALVWLVVFRDVNSVADIYMSAEERTLNLIPFKYNYIGEIIHNIILFIPMGIYISALDFSNIVGRISAITCFGIFLELSKFFLVIGAFDITNIISNAIGGCLGSFVYIAIYFFKKDFGSCKKLVNIAGIIFTIVGLTTIIALQLDV